VIQLAILDPADPLHATNNSLAGPNESFAGPIKSFAGRIESFAGPNDSFAGRIELFAGPNGSLAGPNEFLAGPIESLGPVNGSLARANKSLEPLTAARWVASDQRLTANDRPAAVPVPNAAPTEPHAGADHLPISMSPMPGATAPRHPRSKPKTSARTPTPRPARTGSRQGSVDGDRLNRRPGSRQRQSWVPHKRVAARVTPPTH
jgi:hypothetical protein